METDYGTQKEISRKHLLKSGEKITKAISEATMQYGAGFGKKLEEVARGGLRRFATIEKEDPVFYEKMKGVGKVYRECLESTPNAKNTNYIWKHNVLRSLPAATMEYGMAIDFFESVFEEMQIKDSAGFKESQTREYMSKMGQKLEAIVEKTMAESKLTTEQLSQHLDKALSCGTTESIRLAKLGEPKLCFYIDMTLCAFANTLHDAPYPDAKIGRSFITNSLRKHRPKEHRMVYDQTIDLIETGFIEGKGMDEE